MSAPLLDGLDLALDRESRVLVLTGAGVSAESGIPTFRDQGGLWRNYRPEDLATPEAFARDPKTVWEWYGWRREVVARCRPNPAHDALARLERELDGTLLFTQNVDGLHRRAGSTHVVELHGSLWRTRCTAEGTVADDLQVPLGEVPPRCPGCGGLLRPDVVWFGEALDQRHLFIAFDWAERAQLVLVIGTSSLVQPAAALGPHALAAGVPVIEVNPGETPLSPHATRFVRALAAEAVPRLVDEIVARSGSPA